MKVSKKDKPAIARALYFQIFDVKPRKGEERKMKIIEALLECIGSRGLEHTSFDTVGKMVGMNRTHVSYYFPNRDEMIRTAVRYAVALGQQFIITALEEAKDWKGRLKAVVDGHFEWMETFPHHASVMALFYYLCTYDKEYRKLQTQIQQGGEARLVGCLEPFQTNGKLTPAKTRELARTIQSLLSGNLLAYYSSDYPVAYDRLKRQTYQQFLALVEVATHG